MRSYRILTGVLLVAGAAAAGAVLSIPSAQVQTSAGAAAMQAPAASFPKDVFPESGSRLPGIPRADLDDAGKKLLDAKTPPDFFGPGAIRLYSLPVAEYMGAVNDYLRNKSGLDPKLVQLAILVTAREFDSEYVWTAHEPQGLKAGLPPEIIDVVKYRKPTKGLEEKDAAIIDMGREVLEQHHVSSATFARAQSLFGKQGVVNYASLIGDYAATTILLNTFDQHVRPADKALLPIP